MNISDHIKRPYFKVSFLITCIKYSSILLLCLIFKVIDPNPQYTNFTCIIVILLFGIPHGAADHHIHFHLKKINSSKTIFIAKYLAIALTYSLWWYLAPGKALIGFIIISSYHFGQEFLEHININKINVLDIIIWGSTIMILPLILSYQEVIDSITVFTPFSLPVLPKGLKLISITLLITLVSVHTLKKFLAKRITKNQLIKMIILVAMICFLFSVLPFLVAFTIYFLFFHSSHAFKAQYNWLKSQKTHYSVTNFIKDLLPLSLLSILGLSAIIYLFNPSNWIDILSYFFILISVITLPHAILFDDFYKSRKPSS